MYSFIANNMVSRPKPIYSAVVWKVTVKSYCKQVLELTPKDYWCCRCHSCCFYFYCQLESSFTWKLSTSFNCFRHTTDRIDSIQKRNRTESYKSLRRRHRSAKKVSDRPTDRTESHSCCYNSKYGKICNTSVWPKWPKWSILWTQIGERRNKKIWLSKENTLYWVRQKRDKAHMAPFVMNQFVILLISGFLQTSTRAWGKFRHILYIFFK